MNFRDPLAYHTKLYYESVRSNKMKFDFVFFNVTEYSSFEELSFTKYVSAAHWRWNLFSRGLYGDLPRHSFITMTESDASGSGRSEAERRQQESVNSTLYQVAKARMLQLAHIGIFERMEESIELLCWTFCWKQSSIPFAYSRNNNGRDFEITADMNSTIQKYHNIDVQLYQDAVNEFEKRIADMRRMKEQGFLCHLRRSCLVR